MKVITKSLHLIDTEHEVAQSRKFPKEFDEFIAKLLENITINDNVRQYKTKSLNTLTANESLKINQNITDLKIVENSTQKIANHLL